MADYTYQNDALKALTDLTAEHRYLLLAATPGAGKTNMAIQYIEKFLRKNRKGKVLVLTHGQGLLREQFYNDITSYYRDIAQKRCPFTYDKLLGSISDVSVHIALPHWFVNRDGYAYDLIVVDEAHHYFDAPMVQKVIKANPQAKVLCLTGSPSKFIERETFGKHFLAAEELLDHGVICDPTVKLLPVTSRVTEQDLNDSCNLPVEFKLKTKEVFNALDVVPKQLNATSWSTVKGKTMILAHNKEAARAAVKYLNSKGVGALISTHADDKESGQIEVFRKPSTARILVVVHRGKLGFSMPSLANVVDISYSLNPDMIFQAMCRVVRTMPGMKTEKRFIKVCSDHLAPVSYQSMCFTLALSTRKYFTTYKGDWKNVAAPVPEDFVRIIEAVKQERLSKGEGFRIPKLNLPELPTMTELRDGSGVAFGSISFAVTRLGVFGGVSENVEENKRLLLEMAKRGDTRPTRELKIGRFLNAVTSSTPIHDSHLSNALRAIRPDWFRNSRLEDSKRKIIELASSGFPRPDHKSRLGAFLVSYTSGKTPRDSTFNHEIRKLRPDWFRDTKKASLDARVLEMAKKGESRPNSKTALGKWLTRRLCRDTRFSEIVRRMRPDWFASNRTMSNKNALRDTAKRGDSRPKQSSTLGSALVTYVCATSNSYDPEFAEEIRKLRPDWFRSKPVDTPPAKMPEADKSRKASGAPSTQMAPAQARSFAR
jgi:superfamily II DNA or RNA helicase